MTSTFTSHNFSDCDDRILCYYVNTTNHVQVMRINNTAIWYFERIVAPGRGFVFEAILEAHMEVYIGTENGVILYNKMPCAQLQIWKGRKSAPKSISALKSKDALGVTHGNISIS